MTVQPEEGLCKYMKGGCKEGCAKAFGVPGDRMRGDGHTLKQRIFALSTRKHYVLSG